MIKSKQHPQKTVKEKSSSNANAKLEITSYYMYNKGKKKYSLPKQLVFM